jgi:protein gp37
MGSKSKIAWTQASWNYLRGCSKVSAGCQSCYAERFAARFSGPGQIMEGLTKNGHWTGDVRFVEAHFLDPVRWTKPRKIFVNSQSDTFHEMVSDDTITRAFAVAAICPDHIFQFLTKRAKRMAEWFKWSGRALEVKEAAEKLVAELPKGIKRELPKFHWPLPNVWMGVTTEDQKTADERIPYLLEVPAVVRWLSVEPMVGPIVLKAPELGEWPSAILYHIANGEEWDDWKYWTARMRGVQWIVVGGESGPGRRPMNENWVRVLRDQLPGTGVAFFLKQRVGDDGKKIEMPELDGKVWAEYPRIFG